MKLIGYISDKLSDFYIYKFFLDHSNFILMIIILYLINPKDLIKKYIGKLWKKNVNDVVNLEDNKEAKKEVKEVNKELKKSSNDKDKNISKDNIIVKDIEKKRENNNIVKKENNDMVNKENIEIIIKKEENLPLKNNIKNILRRSNLDPYKNNKESLDSKYNKKPENHEFNININNSICSTPIFTLRSYDNLDFYYNMVIHNFDTQKIYNLNMCKDIHKWMTTSYLSNEDLSDEFIPIYFVYKSKNSSEIYVYEYLKFFVHTNDSGIKNGFIQKGNDYIIIMDDINKLIENNYIKDLLNGEQYINYNLSCNEGTVTFLDKFLSLVLIPEEQIGTQLTLDISNYYENKNTYEYYMKTINSDISMFNTSL